MVLRGQEVAFALQFPQQPRALVDNTSCFQMRLLLGLSCFTAIKILIYFCFFGLRTRKKKHDVTNFFLGLKTGDKMVHYSEHELSSGKETAAAKIFVLSSSNFASKSRKFGIAPTCVKQSIFRLVKLHFWLQGGIQAPHWSKIILCTQMQVLNSTLKKPNWFFCTKSFLIITFRQKYVSDSLCVQFVRTE